MILVNRNFGNPVLAEVIGDMFKGSSDDLNVGPVFHTNALSSGSSLVSIYYTGLTQGYDGSGLGSAAAASAAAAADPFINAFNRYQPNSHNFYIVTEHFLKVLDKVYTKIWNESFTENGIYNPNNLVTLYAGFVQENKNEASDENIMVFKKFVDRCITAGILTEEDRLQYEDQIKLTEMIRKDLSTQVNLDTKTITFTAAEPIDVEPDLNAMETSYLNGKKLYLLMTPYLTNETVIKGINEATQEPIKQQFGYYITALYTGVVKNFPFRGLRQPIAFFKPKTDASKFGRSLPLATHLIWSIGTPKDKAAAELAGTTPPDLVFDHLDRISHIDSLTLKIKFDKLQF